MSGSRYLNVYGTRGTLGVAAAANVPDARSGHTMVLDSESRVIYVHGGKGYIGTGIVHMILFSVCCLCWSV